MSLVFVWIVLLNLFCVKCCVMHAMIDIEKHKNSVISQSTLSNKRLFFKTKEKSTYTKNNLYSYHDESLRFFELCAEWEKILIFFFLISTLFRFGNIWSRLINLPNKYNFNCKRRFIIPLQISSNCYFLFNIPKKIIM